MPTQALNIDTTAGRATLLHHVAMELAMPAPGDSETRRQIARNISKIRGVTGTWYSRLLNDVIVVEHNPMVISAVAVYQATNDLCPVRRKVLF